MSFLDVCFSKILPYLTKQNVNATKTIVAKVKEVFTKKVSSKKKIRLNILNIINILNILNIIYYITYITLYNIYNII